VRTKVLFVCVGNACRSQMAEAIAKHVAADVMEPLSAGLVPFGEITAPTMAVLREHGFSFEGQRSKSLDPKAMSGADLIVNMTGRSGSAVFSRVDSPVEDWDVGDPFGSSLTIYREIRDQIEERVEELARRLREQVDSSEVIFRNTKVD
jgi:arsenate reductase (thioredoxin)